MIHSVFPTNVVVNDYAMSDSWGDAIENAVMTKFYSIALLTNESRKNISEIPADLFSSDSMAAVPELADLRTMFVDSFYELYTSYAKTLSEYGDMILTRDNIDSMLTDTGRIQVMSQYERKGIHNHTQSEAFGVFYLSDVDNAKDGGEIVLHDPSFHHLVDFCAKPTVRFETKKHRMIVGPAHIWHEVTSYFGADERMAVVVNLDHYDKLIY